MLTLAPAIGRLGGTPGGFLLTFGRVPLFVYLLHLYVAHGAAVLVGMLHGIPAAAFFSDWRDAPLLAAGWGFGLPGVYLAWACVRARAVAAGGVVRPPQGAPTRLVARVLVTATLGRPSVEKHPAGRKSLQQQVHIADVAREQKAAALEGLEEKDGIDQKRRIRRRRKLAGPSQSTGQEIPASIVALTLGTPSRCGGIASMTPCIARSTSAVPA